MAGSLRRRVQPHRAALIAGARLVLRVLQDPAPLRVPVRGRPGRVGPRRRPRRQRQRRLRLVRRVGGPPGPDTGLVGCEACLLLEAQAQALQELCTWPGQAGTMRGAAPVEAAAG